MSDNTILHPTTIVIFGATGDLAKRKLFPAFYNLYIDGRMPKGFNILALGRAENTDEKFSAYIKENGLVFRLTSAIFSISLMKKALIRIYIRNWRILIRCTE